MAIDRIIPSRDYELIRERVGEILATELVNQRLLTNDSFFDLDVYVQRSKPIQPTECPLINVLIDNGSFSNSSAIKSDGNYTFYIDVAYIKGATDDERGDVLSSFNAQKLAGICQGILSDPIYLTLGFQRPFIGRSKVTGFEVGTIESGESTNISIVRITLNVMASQQEVGIVPIPLGSSVTQVTLAESPNGYLYVYNPSGDVIDPPDNGCLDATAILRNSANRTLSTTPINSGVTRVISAPNATYEVRFENGTLITSGSIPSDETEIIEIPNPGICEDGTVTLKDVDGNVLSTLEVGSGESIDVEAPNAVYFVEYENGTQIDNGEILSAGEKTIQVPNPIECQGATVTVKNTLNEELSTQMLPCNEPSTIIALDSDYRVQYENGTVIDEGTIPSESSKVIQVPNPIVCSPATVNVNGNLFSTVASGGTLNLPVFQSAGSVTVGAIISGVLRIANSIISNGDNYSVELGAEGNLTLPTENVTVNDSAFLTKASVKNLNIPLVDQSNNAINPISLTGGIIKVNVPVCSPLKRAGIPQSGQTISSITGDDGSTQRGFLTDFLTLRDDSRNIWNHRYRFTGISGGYFDGTVFRDKNGVNLGSSSTAASLAFPNRIVLNWSTLSNLDGSILGLAQESSYVADTLQNKLNEAIGFSLGGFSSGWFMPNKPEFESFCNFSTRDIFNYPPFNSAGAGGITGFFALPSGIIWTGHRDTVSNNYMCFTSTTILNPYTFVARTLTRLSIKFRYFNISELTL